MSTLKLVKRQVVKHKKFQFWNEECLICVILGCKFRKVSCKNKNP